LRASYESFRDRAALLAGEIARDLPEFTVHDVTHLDALWEMADLLVGDEVRLNPAEAYVIGGAILLHDLGLASAAYVDGVSAIREGSAWRDAVGLVLSRSLGRAATLTEIENPDSESARRATAEILRKLHARHAERLATLFWLDDDGTQHYLIEESDLRAAYAPLMGRIAHSHWWDVQRLASEFDTSLGARPWCPGEWTIDALKLAALIRGSDAIHLDARRAPPFLAILRRPAGVAAAHWQFQARLHRPQLQRERLLFTAGRPFAPDEAEAWWLCRDTLAVVDDELRAIDAILDELGRPRLAARSVVAADEPARLARSIPTTGWTPVDARVQISNVKRLVEQLGGKELYGSAQYVPLRELIQNGADAVRARRSLEERDPGWGQVSVKFETSGESDILEVSDDGVGMSVRVLTKTLLDFGSSIWRSPAVADEFPGLASSGYESTGRYGIGFFSVFMWADRVEVFTRPYGAAHADTQVLEFNAGLGARPLLRPAAEAEYIREGGTRIRLSLRTRARAHGGAFSSWRNGDTLAGICAWLCPTLDVALTVSEDGSESVAVEAGDWHQIGPEDLLRRVAGARAWEAADEVFRNEAAERIRPLPGSTGDLAGRAAVTPRSFVVERRDELEIGEALSGAVSVGGLRACYLTGISGVLLGRSLRAARDAAEPVVPPEALATWASEQADLVESAAFVPDELIDCAEIIRLCGGDTRGLPIAEVDGGLVSFAQVVDWARDLDEVALVHDAGLHLERRYHGEFDLHRNVIATARGVPGVLQTGRESPVSWPERPEGADMRLLTLTGAVVVAIAEAWDDSVDGCLSRTQRSTDEVSIPYTIGVRNGDDVIGDSVDILRRAGAPIADPDAAAAPTA
jgi:hypothetical protein